MPDELSVIQSHQQNSSLRCLPFTFGVTSFVLGNVSPDKLQIFQILHIGRSLLCDVVKELCLQGDVHVDCIGNDGLLCEVHNTQQVTFNSGDQGSYYFT